MIENVAKLLLPICLVAVTTLNASALTQQSVYEPEFGVFCRVEINGQFENVLVFIDMRRPDIGDDDGWGTFRPYEGANSEKTNCNGDRYDYAVIDVDHAWEQEQEFPEGSGLFRTFSHTDNKRFWDWYYEGYTAPDTCDYTQNCHGYAFGVGDWPYTATPIIDNRPIPDPLPPDPIPPPCYVGAEVKEAQIASDPPSHSIKVQGAECEVEPPPGPPIPIPDPGPGGPPMAQALVASWEQYRESGTYSQSAECPDSVNLKRPGKWHTHLNFQLLKPNGG